jgi:hypothetical protein
MFCWFSVGFQLRSRVRVVDGGHAGQEPEHQGLDLGHPDAQKAGGAGWQFHENRDCSCPCAHAWMLGLQKAGQLMDGLQLSFSAIHKDFSQLVSIAFVPVVYLH